MELEFFRHDEIGEVYFSLTRKDGTIDDSKQVFASYISYAFQAFYLMMQDVEQLEHAKGNLVPRGRHSITTVSLWFLCTEAHINALLKLVCLKAGEEFDSYKPKGILERLTALLGLLQIDDVKVKKTGCFSRLMEFMTFRNEIFHDRNIGNRFNFKKTAFSPIPIQCNLVDVLQGLLVYLEIASLLRKSISGLDSMPDILIHANRKVFHKKLDYLYFNLIKPSIEGILAKHQLSTKLLLPSGFPDSEKSLVFQPAEVGAFLGADSPDVYKFMLNSAETRIVTSHFFSIIQNEDVEPDKLRVGHYSIAGDQDISKNPLANDFVVVEPG